MEIEELRKEYQETNLCPICKRRKLGPKSGFVKKWMSASQAEKEEAIYNCLIQYPEGLIILEIGEKIKMSYQKVSAYINVLHAKGKIKYKQIGRGRLIKAIVKKTEQKERAEKIKEEEYGTMDTKLEKENNPEKINQVQETVMQTNELDSTGQERVEENRPTY